MFSNNTTAVNKLPLIGVGLRSEHYNDALNAPANIDFIEVHAENFFAKGGASHDLLDDIKQHYAISIHATSLGLGSVIEPPRTQVDQLAHLLKRCQPILVSDHACFSWADVQGVDVHAGDLLPIPFNDESLQVMSNNILRVQNILGRKILVENLSAYIQLPGSTYSESEFLVKLCELTGCKLLIDLNNLVVNATNHKLLLPQEENPNVVEYAKQWLNNIPTNVVGEFHLAGCTPVIDEQLMVDDHSQPVSIDTWEIYHFALKRFGAIPTLIEWDSNLPTWDVLLSEAKKAKDIAINIFGDVDENDTVDDVEWISIEDIEHA